MDFQVNRYALYYKSDYVTELPIEFQIFWDYVNSNRYQMFLIDYPEYKNSYKIREVYFRCLQKLNQLDNLTLQKDSIGYEDKNNLLQEFDVKRLLIGHHGIYIEFSPVLLSSPLCKQICERTDYTEYIYKRCKVYHQKQTVNYADYKIGLCYIDIFQWLGIDLDFKKLLRR